MRKALRLSMPLVLGLFMMPAIAAAREPPILLTAQDLDHVTAGALAAAGAAALATGVVTTTTAGTATRATDTKAKAAAGAAGAGTGSSAATTDVLVQGDYITATAGGTAQTEDAGASKSRTNGAVHSTAHRETVIVRTTSVARGEGAEVDTGYAVNAPDNAKVTVRTVEHETSHRTVSRTVVRVTVRK